MNERLRAFMYGRYGQDNLNKFLSIASLIVLVISMITKIAFLNSFAMILLLVSIFRMMSKNTFKRSQENSAYLWMKRKISGCFPTQNKEFIKWKARLKTRYNERNTHRFFICPTCRVQIRVPKGRGKIVVTCPKCHTSFTKQT